MRAGPCSNRVLDWEVRWRTPRTAGVTAGSAVVRPLWWVEREDPHTTTRVKSLCRYNANWMGDSPINCDSNEGGATILRAVLQKLRWRCFCHNPRFCRSFCHNPRFCGQYCKSYNGTVFATTLVFAAVFATNVGGTLLGGCYLEK